MSTLRTILHPTDFSAECEPAFAVACSLAKDYGARLVLLHVMRPSVAPVMNAAMANPLEPAEAQQALQGKFAWPVPTTPGVRVDHRVAEGDAVEEIVRLAHSLQCDLIVMGTHGRTGWNRLLTGSVAEGVVRQADCPVMTIKNSLSPAAVAAASTKLVARAGDVLDVRPLGSALTSASSSKLAASHGIEISRLILPAGKEMYQYKLRGTAILQCLEGRIAITALGKTHKLEAGELLFLPPDEPHTLEGIENASVLLTSVLPA